MARDSGMPRFRRIWSTVQVGLLSAAVLFCIVMLAIGGGQLTPVYAVAAIFFGFALLGHTLYLVIMRRAEQQR